MTYYSEVVDSLESAKWFMDVNKVKPYMVILVWEEDDNMEEGE